MMIFAALYDIIYRKIDKYIKYMEENNEYADLRI